MVAHLKITEPLQTGKNPHPEPVSVSAIEKKYGMPFPFTVAAPSFVIPAGVVENSHFLADCFPEVALLLFESEACLAYTDIDLPTTLAALPVSWHVHLPLDLAWDTGLDRAWETIAILMDKIAFLAPRAWVLHPPAKPDMLGPLAKRFCDFGVAPADVLLENVDESDLTAIWPEVQANGFSVCLDLGHILAYDQHPVLDLPGLWEIVRMLHIYAADKGSGKHNGLEHLDEHGRNLLRTILKRFKGDTLTLEIFNEAIFASLDLLAGWMADWRKDR